VENEARGLLDFLIAKPLCRADIRAHLSSSPTIPTQVAQTALVLVDHYREEVDPERYDQASWAIVRLPYLNAFQYRFALKQAETACRRAPQEGKYLTTLGAAQYRAGAYENALKTLMQTAALNQGHPVDLSFLAMTQHELGQKELAQVTLTRLREAMHNPEWAKHEEAARLLRGAEVLIESKATDPKK
jgi:tetratricopeptide (TPR) repeat protein